MKNLAILTILIFSASIVNAQISQDCKSEKQLDNQIKKTTDIILTIPMLGNVKVKNADYKFKEATMAFQIEKLLGIEDSVGYVSVDTLNQIALKKAEEKIEMKNESKMEDKS